MANSLTFAVPVTWDSSRAYERNMIVFVGKKAYTAIQDVPTGTQITNTSYWIETGVPSIDIAQLESDLQTLSDSVDDLSDDVSANSTAITNNANDITTLTGRLNTAVTSIENDAARLNNIMITLYTPTT